MRCHRYPAQDCVEPELCELMSCQSGVPQLTGLAVQRVPIDLNYQPGRVMRAMMALTDRTERVVRRGPTPLAATLPAPEPPPMSQPSPQEPPPPRLTEPTPPAAPAPSPAPAPPVADLRILAIPNAFVVYLGDRPLGMVMRIEQIGPPR
jgi:hypothetical protein